MNSLVSDLAWGMRSIATSNVVFDVAIPVANLAIWAIGHYSQELVNWSQKCYHYYRNKGASEIKFDRAFKSMPEEEKWRLYIDWKRQDPLSCGKQCFDREEPGYAAGMDQALSYVRSSLGTKMDADELRYIHDLAVDGVFHKRFESLRPFALGYSCEYKYYFNRPRSDHPPETTRSKAALKEALEEGIFTHDTHCDEEKFLAYYDQWFMNSLASCNEAATKERINRLFNTYYETITRASSVGEKLRAIVDLCRSLEVFHAFPDGNQRTISFLLLQKLLIENGLPPVILELPLLFDGLHTREEMVLMVRQGMERLSRFIFNTTAYRHEIDEGIEFTRDCPDDTEVRQTEIT